MRSQSDLSWGIQTAAQTRQLRARTAAMTCAQRALTCQRRTAQATMMTSPTALNPNTGALWYPGFENTPEPNPDTLFSMMITNGTPKVHAVRIPTQPAGPTTPDTLIQWLARVRSACAGCPSVPVRSRDQRTTRDACVPDA